MSSRDSFEKEQKRLQDLFDAASTPESSQDPFAEDGEYGSDDEYQPSRAESTTSEDETQASKTRRTRQITAAISSGESTSSSSSDADDDADKTSCSDSTQLDGNRENIEVTRNTDCPVDLIQEPVPLITGLPSIDEEYPNTSLEPSNQLNPVSVSPRRSETPVIEELWSETVTDIPDFNFDTSQCGVTVNVDSMNQVIDFFHLVFPQSYIEYLVNCTNNYGNALCNTNRPHTRHSRKTVYRETNCEEMMKFLGITLLKGHSIHDNRRFRPSTSSAPQPENISVTENLMSGHWPEQVPSRPGIKKKFAFLKCKVCTKNKIRRETSYRCKGCPDKPPLCPSCFEIYHKSIRTDE